MKGLFCVALMLACFAAVAQQRDTTEMLQPVLIEGFAMRRPPNEVAASIGFLRTNDLRRFGNTSFLPALNTMPGVRMEERSPGSYRFSIRGSLLRSPFGVRNVKMYWNGLPLTDGGGNTYLNLLDFASVGTVEVIKGPGGSLYGAGTGGVVLLTGSTIKNDQLAFSTVAGSFGLQRYQLTAQTHSQKTNVRLLYARQQSKGYREQTEMLRDALNAHVVFQLDSQSAFSATILYSDLFYETPGALTQAEFDENPKQARPPSGANSGTVEQRAAVHNKTPYLGLTYEHDWNNAWSTRAGIFGSLTDFHNPTIRNYEQRTETNLGGRAESQYKFGSRQRQNQITLGGEYQYFRSPVDVYGNDLGTADTLQTKDRLSARQVLLFAQAAIQLPANFFITAGVSINFTRYGFARTFPQNFYEERNFDPDFSPRIALLNKITPGFSVYANFSRGFSPPTWAELYPSRQVFDKNIEAERGNNFEAGFRGVALHHALNFDVSIYEFQLKEALVIRRDTTLFGDPEYFVNAGATSQRGIEAMISWQPISAGKKFISDLKIWNSWAYSHYRFKEYVQDGNDYSGNNLTGVPPVVNTTGVDLVIRKRFYTNITGSYVADTPLNDANTVFAREYFLLGGRFGFKTNINDGNALEIFAGVDNALNERYSLGNDLNAFGGRYYNAASPRNFYAGATFKLSR